MKMAFIMPVIPHLTSTFISREFEYLNDQTDLDLHSIAMKRPETENLNKEYIRYLKITKYLRPDSIASIICFNLRAAFTRPLRYLNIFRQVLSEMRKHSSFKRRRLLFHFFCGIYLSYYLTQHRFDAIHAHFETATTIAFIAHLFCSIPFFITFHANYMYMGSVFFESKIRHANIVITNNSYNEMHINLLTNYRYKDKINVIYNGLDLTIFQGATEKKIRSDPMRLLSIGSFSGIKGYPTVLKALKLIKEDGLSFKYKIIGGGYRKEEEMIRRLIQQYGLGGNVSLLGRLPFTRVRQELIESDVEIMASEISNMGNRDGFPNVIIEAMLLKRPVISTYISDIPTIVNHKETGFLFPEKKADDLADILRHLYHHYEETLTVVQRAHEIASNTFDATKNYSLLYDILSSYQSSH